MQNQGMEGRGHKTCRILNSQDVHENKNLLFFTYMIFKI
jgi:hypothetical protein